MADTFGILELPLVAPTQSADAPGSTTTLEHVALSYFRAVLNANAAIGWRGVYKDQVNAPVVREVVTDAPGEATMNDSKLPTLYLWRESAADPERIAEDWFVQDSVLRLVWLAPTAIQVKRQLRSIILSGIAATLMSAVENDRDPAWVVASDTDPQAATKGSFFSKYGGWLEFLVGAWKPYTLPLRTADKNALPITYEGLSLACRVRERLTVDLARFDPNQGLELTQTTGDGLVTEHIILP